MTKLILMFKIIGTALLSITVVVSSCDKKYNLKGTEWLTVRFSVDSSNYLPEFEKNAYLSFDTSTKLHTKFSDSLIFAFVEGKTVDTSIYKIRKDTLFYIQGSLRDTAIILKLTSDSLIEQRLAGVKTYSIRIKD